MKSNVKDDVCYAQPRNLSDRLAIANDFTKRFHFPVPFGVDDMNNAANDAYAAWPERLYIIDENGKIAYRGGMGPFNYNPSEVRAWLAARYGQVKHTETLPPEQKPNQKTEQKQKRRKLSISLHLLPHPSNAPASAHEICATWRSAYSSKITWINETPALWW